MGGEQNIYKRRIKMIYITGDPHIPIDIHKLSVLNFLEQISWIVNIINGILVIIMLIEKLMINI